MPNVDFNGKGQIVIDAQIFRGSSGSPVFVAWDDWYSLLGVVTHAVFLNSELQTLPTSMSRVGVQQILGLGLVIKQRHVRELIDYALLDIHAKNISKLLIRRFSWCNRLMINNRSWSQEDL